MTTAPAETPTPWLSASGPGVRGPLFTVLLTGLVLVTVAGVLEGPPAGAGAAIGAAMVCLFFGLGAGVLAVVARLAPAASLLVALLTYTLKVVLVAVVFLALTRSGALGASIDAEWLAGAVIACTLVWLVTQIVVSTRARQPLYDLPDEGTSPGTSEGPEARVR